MNEEALAHWGAVAPKTKQKDDHIPILVEACREVIPYLHDHNMESRSAIQQNSS
jgi:hypothetical protein